MLNTLNKQFIYPTAYSSNLNINAFLCSWVGYILSRAMIKTEQNKRGSSDVYQVINNKQCHVLLCPQCDFCRIVNTNVACVFIFPFKAASLVNLH